MGVFGVFFGCRGDVGFSGPLLWVCSGVVGFNAAVFLSPVRDVFRPASPSPAAVHEKVLWSSCKREKVRPAHEKWPKMGVLWRAGRVFSRIGRRKPHAGRTSSRKRDWRGCAGRVCGPAVVGSRASFDAARSRQLGPSTGTLNPSMRSYTHLVVAGRGCPTGLSNPPRNAKR